MVGAGVAVRRTPSPRAKEEPQEDGRRVNLHLESNPIPTRDAQRAQTNLVCTLTQEPHRDWDRTGFECLLCRYGSAVDCHRGRGPGCKQTWVWHKSSRRRSPLTSIEPPELTLDWETNTWRAQTELCEHQGPGERSSDPTRHWPRLARKCPGVSGRGLGWWWPAAGFGPLSTAVHTWDLLKDVAIIFITSTIVWPQVNSREGTQLQPSTENWIKDLLSVAPPIRTRPSPPQSVSPTGSFHQPLILLHQRADELKTTIPEN